MGNTLSGQARAEWTGKVIVATSIDKDLAEVFTAFVTSKRSNRSRYLKKLIVRELKAAGKWPPSKESENGGA